MNELITRTPSVIATEINSIKEQTQKMLLFNSIEIGRRLVEAKQMLPHGQWGDWLEQSVDYSQRTASNLMKIFNEYGSKQITLFGSNANSQALANLSYTQAVALLGIPQDEREEFVEQNDLDSMSTRELQQAIREKQELEQRLKQTENDLEVAKKQADSERQARERISESYDGLEKVNSKHYETVQQLKRQLEEAKDKGNSDDVNRLLQSLDQANRDLADSRQKIEDLEQQLKAPVEPVIVTKVPDEVERELQELRAKTQNTTPVDAAEIKYRVCFDSLVKGFGELLGALNGIDDPEAHEKYKGAVKALIGKMAERL